MLLVAILAAGCGGGGSTASAGCSLGSAAGCGGSLPPPTGSNPPPADPAASVASVSVVTSSANLPSSGLPGTEVTVTALLKNTANVGVAGVPVEFSVDSGFLSVANAVSDASGKVVASLGTGGSPANRQIAVRAKAGSQAGSAVVNVSGTHLSFNAPATLAAGSSATVTATVFDAAERPLAGVPVSVSAKNGNQIAAMASLTDSRGQVPVQLNGSVRGSEQFTVSAAGASVIRSVTVTGGELTLSPAVATDANGAEVLKEIAVGSCTPVDATSTTLASGTVNLATSRGTLYLDAACSKPLGGALSYSGGATRTWLRSDSAGVATIDATLPSGTRASTRVEFVASLQAGARVDLQADQALVGTGEQSILVAMVRDGTAANNAVKGATVQFSILADPSGGALLSPLSAVTGSDGAARVVFVAGPNAGGAGSTIIQARLADLPTVTGAASLTVNKKALSIQVGTGNKTARISPAVLQKEFAVFVADNAGNPVKDVTVSASAWATTYRKGFMTAPVKVGESWSVGVSATCANEDLARRGIYDAALDRNGNGVLDPGVPLTVSVSGKTDEMGMATVLLRYPADRAVWVDAELTVSGTVTGTEGHARTTLTLPGIAEDYLDKNVPPPGYVSPYGSNPSCASSG
ncbi:Ig-like domain-containing protein [Massilia agilis]|uniref:Ig-like domain-containing protein n=1 Tax=Massilia agilis TaxID=1811226 RepID=A0ABT2D8Y1_9BURK|nr:Ig-like domain-containing protein [Massilia agilis]MCS0807744.1 Ig-like domain-containing protein [Massilia agilis]